MKKLSKRVLAVILTIAMLLPMGTFGVVSNAEINIPSDAVMFNGNAYKVYKDSLSWVEAKEYCEKLGGHLATIVSEEEQRFIEGIIEDVEQPYVRLGACRDADNNFVWVTSEPFEYTNWAKGEPNNIRNSEKYLMLYTATSGFETGKWNDTATNYPNYKYAFVCEWDFTEYTIKGLMTGSSSDNRISIDNVWYPYDSSVPGLSEALSHCAINETIFCKMKCGTIVACSKTEIRNNASISITPNVSTVTYDAETKKYDMKQIDLNVNVTNRIVSSTPGCIDMRSVAGYDIEFDKIEVQIDANDFNLIYFKDGWFGKKQEFVKQFDSPIVLKSGEVFNYNEDLNVLIRDNYQWGETESKRDVAVTAYLYYGDNFVSAVTQKILFKNSAVENNIKKQEDIDKQCGNASSWLDNTACVIQNEFLSEIFTRDELKDIQNALACKVALGAISETTYEKAGIDEKLMEKLMSKAGINKEWFGTTYTADISLLVQVDTQKYGRLEIEFSAPQTTYYAFNPEKPYAAASFNIQYKVTKGKVPQPSAEDIGMLVYANMQNFVSSVRSIALEQLESAYNLGYGNDLNKVAEMLFGDTVTQILSKTKAKSYSHLTFSMMTFPSKKIGIHCPVDVYVYDVDGTLCASIIDNEIVQECEDIDIEVIGDEKYLSIYEGDYSVELIATANDQMNITVEEYASPTEMIRSVRLDNIELTPGDSFKTTIDESNIANDYILDKNETDTISADSDHEYIHYIEETEIVDTPATCTENGAFHIECAVCKEVISTGIIEATGHNDDNHDGVCDNCGEDFTKDCDCFCHSESKFVQFIYKIVRFLWKLFGIEDRHFCACGKAHW